MLVFCEDCGTKHTVADSEVADKTFQLRCDVCNFLITTKSLPKPKVAPKTKVAVKPVDLTMELTCSHDVLEFGHVGDQEKVQTLILAAKDGRRVELTGKVDVKLKGNVSISAVSGMAFKVEVVSPSHVAGTCLTEYQGPGVIINDSISNFKKVVPLSFVRR